jgi:clan AA aspartic protease (TIGR02281 family)
MSMAHAIKSRVHYLLGEMDEAIEQLSECVELQPENTEAYEQRAQLYYEQEQYELADKDYERLIELDRGGVMGYMGIGRNAVAQGKYNEAIKQFDYVLKMHTDYSSGYSFRAEAYIKQGEYTKAADDIVKALEINGDRKAFYLLQDMADSAKIVVEAKLKAKSLKDKSTPEWQEYLGIVNEYAKDYPKAIEYYKKAMEIYPSAYDANRIYVCYEAMGNYTKALEYIDHVIEMDSTDVDDIQRRAEALFYLGRMDECLQTIDRYVEETPDFFGGYVTRGFFKICNNDLEGAIEDFSMAIALKPEVAYPYTKRGEAYMRQGNEEAAKADYLKVIELDTVPNRESTAMYAYQALGDLDKAKEFMQRLIDEDPDYGGNYYDAACLYARMGDKEKALEYLRQALDCGYRDFAHIAIDYDMDNLREVEEFKALIEEYKETYQWGESDAEEKTYEELTMEVPFTKDGNMCMVKCTINNLPLHFIFDTGASSISMSDVEATFMMKNGYLSSKDVVGKQHFLTADGSVSEGTVLNLRNVNFGGLNLDNIQASVVKNQRAPLLLGQSVMQKLGRIEIDNERRVLKITYKKVVEN